MENKMKKDIIKDIIVALIPAFLVFIIEFIYNYAICRIFIIQMNFNIMLLEIIIMYLVYFMLCGITKKTGRATVVLSIVIFIISTINLVKIAFTGEPVFFSDILFLNSSYELLDIINGTFVDTIKLIIVPILVQMLVFILIILIGIKNSMEIKEKRVRITMTIISLLILILLFLPVESLNKFVLNYFFEINERKDYGGHVSNIQYYIRYGTITGMYGYLLENRIVQPDDYDENQLNEELRTAEGEKTNKKFGMPNIIIVFSESFWDIGQLEEVKFNKEVAPNLNKYKDEGLFFNMISPSYGGNSANVEFEFLTGANTMYFTRGYIPYMQLYRNDKYYDKPSIITELKNNGYRTKIVACSSKRLFNCGRFYNYLKVDETEFLTDITEGEKKGLYISDETVTNKIINEFENKQANEKLFYMTLTMQAHYPYTITKYENYDIEIIESDLSDNLNDTLKSYAQGIYDADKELGRLYKYIKQYEEPTIIIFYGDHLPYLNKGKEDATKVLKYFNTEDSTLNEYRKYNTQALILANFELEKEENTKYLGADLLSAYVLNNMNIDISDYYKWLYDTKDVIGAANYRVLVDQEGNLYRTDELNGEIKELYNLRRSMQYKLFIK